MHRFQTWAASMLRRFEAAEGHGREASQAIHANCLHMFLFFFFAEDRKYAA